MGSSSPATSWRAIPLAFFGYGFLYAWGYVSWSTPSLATQAVSGGEFDLSWLVSAATVPAMLVALAWASTRRDVGASRAAFWLAPALAALGSVLSVAYQHVDQAGLSWCLAVASGLCTGAGSALFSLLWSLALSRLDMAALEAVVPLSFVASALCALVVPSLGQLPALAVALLLVAACALSLGRARAWVGAACAGASGGASGGSGMSGSRFPAEGGAYPCAVEGVPAIARMLAFGVVAWTVMDFSPAAMGAGADQLALPALAGVDVVGVVGYLLSIALALLIIRFAVRVDFQALSLMTLPVLVLSTTLLALGAPAALFWGSALFVALNSSCEIILLLYFIRIAQGRPERRAFWLALGSAASYSGVFIGQFASGLAARAGLAQADPALTGLVVVCVYAFAMLLIPQRSYEAGVGAGGSGVARAGGGAADAAGGAGGAGGAAPGRASSSVAAGPAHSASGAPSSASAPARPAAGVASAAPGTTLVPLAPELAPASPGPAAPEAADPIAAGVARVAERYRLSAREAQVCEYLARGRSQTYIRDALLLSKNTVATHVRRIYTKLDVHSKQELIDLVENPDA